jgi:hypothetical protein
VAGGTETDAIGVEGDLPYLSEKVRVAAVKDALARDDRSAAEAAAARGVLAPADGDTVLVNFVGPPDWSRFGDALWDPDTGLVHAVFGLTDMLVDGAAILGCVGLPFEDEQARRECAAWCLRNGLDDLAASVGRTPVGGEGPHCTWPSTDIEPEEHRQPEPEPSSNSATERPEEQPMEAERSTGDAGGNVVPLFGGVFDSGDA